MFVVVAGLRGSFAARTFRAAGVPLGTRDPCLGKGSAVNLYSGGAENGVEGLLTSKFPTGIHADHTGRNADHTASSR
jgi:hypothetical protein